MGPDFEETAATAPLHIVCSSKQALSRQIADVDNDAAFLWFSGESEAQKRGSICLMLSTQQHLVKTRLQHVITAVAMPRRAAPTSRLSNSVPREFATSVNIVVTGGQSAAWYSGVSA
ncbi:MAG TPA: hypothetical protein VI320_11460 [Terracidiphilus sp.]